MKLVYTNPNPSGAYPPIQEGNFSSVPEGMSVWPDDLQTDVFYGHNGFVTLSLAEQKIVTGQEEVILPAEEGGEPVVQLRDVTSTISVVTACRPNLEAWQAWQSSMGPVPDPLDTAKSAKLAELSAACNTAITAGCDVELSSGAGHIALTAEDQINLSTAMSAVEQGAAGYPYHLDGQLCAVYPAADIRAMAAAATAHKLYHTTYYNHLAAWVRRCERAEEVQGITYGVALPEDLAANMAAVLASAGGAADV